jgi:LEA14-like dessication related protein
MNPARKLPLLAVLFLVSLPSCVAGGKGWMPTVDFDRLDVKDLSFENISTDFVFVIDNPNPIDIDFARFDYSLSFGGIEWVSGDDPDGLTLEARGDSELALPVDLVFQSLYEMVRAVRGEDTIPFELTGSFGFDSPIGVIDLPYDVEGGFPALRAPSFSFKKIVVSDYGWDGIELKLKLDADNDHESNVAFTHLDYDLGVEDIGVASGSVASLGTVAGASTKTLTVPVGFDTSDAIVALLDVLLTQDEVNLHFAGQTDVEIPFWPNPITLFLDETGLADVQF